MENNSSLKWSVGIIAVSVLIIGLIVFANKFATQNGPITDTRQLAAPVTAADHAKGGSADAKVTLLEYSDFQCPACAAYFPLVKQLTEEYGDKVRFVYRHFPLPQHANAKPAAYAAEAAGKQGKFFEMHDLLFTNQKEWENIGNPTSKFESYAATLGLNIEQFKADSASGETKSRVDAEYSSGQQSAVNSTPTFFLNGVAMPSPRSYQEFKAYIDSALAQ